MQITEEEPIIKVDEVEIYENDFELAIAEACQKFQIEDLVKESQRRWKAVMEYVGKRLFPDNKLFRDRTIVWLNNNKIPTNNNRYDYDIINSLCDYYMYLSDRYNKLISTVAFSLFIGVSRDTIGNWKEDKELNSTRYHIYKKIIDQRFDCVTDDAYDNGNVTGTMYVGNVEFGTNLPGVRGDQGSSGRKPQIPAEQMLAIEQADGPEADF